MDKLPAPFNLDHVRHVPDIPALSDPIDDRWPHRILKALVRFRAWLMGGVFTAGAMAAIYCEDGSFLLVKPHYRAGWGLPGGFMKHGEQSPETVKRELVEEVGIPDDATILGPVVVYTQPGRRHIDHLYFVPLKERFVVKHSITELAEAKWFSRPDFPQLQTEAHHALNWIRLHF